jgi:hypothetical protein
MNVTGGITVTVHRATRDRFGDAAADTLVATVSHCVHQPSTGLNLDAHPTDQFAETSALTSVLWVPRGADIKDKDRLNWGGKTYRVIGDPAWADNHPVTGTAFSHYAVQIEGVQ